MAVRELRATGSVRRCRQPPSVSVARSGEDACLFFGTHPAPCLLDLNHDRSGAAPTQHEQGRSPTAWTADQLHLALRAGDDGQAVGFEADDLVVVAHVDGHGDAHL